MTRRQKCGRVRVTDGAVTITVRHTPAEHEGESDRRGASARGLMLCGAATDCGYCAIALLQQRARQLQELERFAREEGWGVYMWTPTIRHRASDKLRYLRTGLQGAWSRLQRLTTWQRLNDEHAPWWVAVREGTHGRAGWHAHKHVLFTTTTPLDDFDELDEETGELELGEMSTLRVRLHNDWKHCVRESFYDLRLRELLDVSTKKERRAREARLEDTAPDELRELRRRALEHAERFVPIDHHQGDDGKAFAGTTLEVCDVADYLSKLGLEMTDASLAKRAGGGNRKPLQILQDFANATDDVARARDRRLYSEWVEGTHGLPVHTASRGLFIWLQDLVEQHDRSVIVEELEVPPLTIDVLARELPRGVQGLFEAAETSDPLEAVCRYVRGLPVRELVRRTRWLGSGGWVWLEDRVPWDPVAAELELRAANARPPPDD